MIRIKMRRYSFLDKTSKIHFAGGYYEKKIGKYVSCSEYGGSRVVRLRRIRR